MMPYGANYYDCLTRSVYVHASEIDGGHSEVSWKAASLQLSISLP
jgi:hypothetical protein